MLPGATSTPVSVLHRRRRTGQYSKICESFFKKRYIQKWKEWRRKGGEERGRGGEANEVMGGSKGGNGGGGVNPSSHL